MIRPADATCGACGKPVLYDLVVSDDLWSQIAPKSVDGWKSGGMLCPECILATALMAERERAARIAEEFPDKVLAFWERPHGPPGNGYRESTFADVASAIRDDGND